MEVENQISSNNNNNGDHSIVKIQEDGYKDIIGETIENPIKISNDIKENCLSLLNLKERDQYTSSDMEFSQKLESNLLISFINLKLSNRITHLETENKRNQLSQEREKLNSLNLLYQNYVYEKNHLLKEIKAYSDFHIEDYEPKLVPLEYYENSIKNNNISSHVDLNNNSNSSSIDNDNINYKFQPVNTDNEDLNQHNQSINRLTFELNERTKKLEQLNKINSKRKLCDQIVQSKRTFLESLPKVVKDINNRVSNLQSNSNIHYDHKTFQLPKPLYILYSSIFSFIQSSQLKSKLSLKVNGDYEKPYLLSEKNSTVHPLSVLLEYIESIKIKVQVYFYYWIQSNQITCKVLNHNDFFLENLLEQSIVDYSQQKNNSGLQSPLPNLFLSSPLDSPQILSNNSDTPTNFNNLYGKHYKWIDLLSCQLTTNQYNSDSGSSNNHFTLISNVMNSIYKRIETKISLEKQIQQLKKQTVTNIDINSQQAQFLSIQEEFDNVLKLIFKNSLFEITIQILISIEYPIVPPIFQLFSTLIQPIISQTTTNSNLNNKGNKNNKSNNNDNNGDNIFDKNQILLLQKETLKHIETELNCNYNIKDNNDILINQVQKLKSIIIYLSDQSQIRSNSKGRITRGKLRVLPLLQDPVSLKWYHK